MRTYRFLYLPVISALALLTGCITPGATVQYGGDPYYPAAPYSGGGYYNPGYSSGGYYDPGYGSGVVVQPQVLVAPPAPIWYSPYPVTPGYGAYYGHDHRRRVEPPARVVPPQPGWSGAPGRPGNGRPGRPGWQGDRGGQPAPGARPGGGARPPVYGGRGATGMQPGGLPPPGGYGGQGVVRPDARRGGRQNSGEDSGS